MNPNCPVIHAGNVDQHLNPLVDGVAKGKGLIPRDFTQCPQGCYASAPAFDVPLIPRSEWSQRIKDLTAAKARLSDIRRQGNNGAPIPSLDQGQKGYCWAHSTTMAVMLNRAVANLAYVPLSAYAVACIIKQYRDEGGWGALSLDFATTRGIPAQTYWPQGSMSRSNDNPTTWASAARHKSTEGFVDLNAAVYDRTLTFDQEITLLLSGIPVIGDFNFWSHSVCLMDAVEGEPERRATRDETSGKLVDLPTFEEIWGMNDPVMAGIGVKGLNSWSDSYGDLGEFVLAGQHAVVDGATAPRSSTASAA